MKKIYIFLTMVFGFLDKRKIICNSFNILFKNFIYNFYKKIRTRKKLRIFNIPLKS